MLPNVQTLTEVLNTVLVETGTARSQLTVIDRKPADHTGSAPSEIVTCRFMDGAELRVFCKYGDRDTQARLAYRFGVAYEATVYRHVLKEIATPVPAFYGTHRQGDTGATWLILEFLEETIPLNNLPSWVSAMHQAARRIAAFHTSTETYLANVPDPPLKRYDAEQYLGWMDRPSEFGSVRYERYPWLRSLMRGYAELVDLLLTAPVTIIHGELESDNIRFGRGEVYFIDWESAAIAAGEIDLASLTWGWDSAKAEECELEYRRSRWPQGAPDNFDLRLAAAKLYLHFRWRGDWLSRTITNGSAADFEKLRTLGKRVGLI